MTYKLKEYTFVFDTPAKKHQEQVIVDRIMDLLNSKKYETLDDFIARNNNYRDFLKNNNLDNVVKHFGNTLSEEDYMLILGRLKDLTKTKSEFSQENIKTVRIQDSEYTSYKGKDNEYVLDNSIGDRTINSQLAALQPTEQKFQTADKEKNTEAMFGELEHNKKETINLKPLDQIDRSMLNLEKLELFNIAANYAKMTGKQIRLDVDRGVLADEENNIMRIIENSGQYTIQGDQSTVLDSGEMHEEKEATKQFVLKPKQDAIYNDN